MSNVPSLQTLSANAIYNNEIEHEDIPIEAKESIERVCFEKEYKRYLDNKAKELAKANKRQRIPGHLLLNLKYDDNLEKILIAARCNNLALLEHHLNENIDKQKHYKTIIKNGINNLETTKYLLNRFSDNLSEDFNFINSLIIKTNNPNVMNHLAKVYNINIINQINNLINDAIQKNKFKKFDNLILYNLHDTDLFISIVKSDNLEMIEYYVDKYKPRITNKIMEISRQTGDNRIIEYLTHKLKESQSGGKYQSYLDIWMNN